MNFRTKKEAIEHFLELSNWFIDNLATASKRMEDIVGTDLIPLSAQIILAKTFLFQSLDHNILISNFYDSVHPYKDKIEGKDEDFFLKINMYRIDNTVFTKIKALWISKHGLTETEKGYIWEVIDELLETSEIYRELNRRS